MDKFIHTLKSQLIVFIVSFIHIILLFLFGIFHFNDLIYMIALVGGALCFGCVLGYKMKQSGLTYPIYCFLIMLLFALNKQYPFYSSDWGTSGPVIIYSTLIFIFGYISLVIGILGARRKLSQSKNNNANAADTKEPRC